MPELHLKPGPRQAFLGDQPLQLMRLGDRKVWPACNPTVAGIAINVLEATVKEPATGPVTVDWGDGSTPEVLTPSGGEVTGCHHYATPGVRRILLSGAVVKNQKVNAGVVPANTVQMVHGFDTSGFAEMVYQCELGNTQPAGRDTKEATPYCDGVFRYHLWIGDPSAGHTVLAAFDVSFKGSWWDISGGNNLLRMGRFGAEDFSSALDYPFLSQVYDASIVNNMDAQTFWLNNSTWPGTSNEWATDKNYPALTIIGTGNGHLLNVHMSSDDKILLTAWANKENLLDQFGDPPGSQPGALPPGLDLTMMPILFKA